MVALATERTEASSRTKMSNTIKTRRSINSSANNSIYRYQAPYNTGNDFVYNDDFTDPIAKYKEVTSQATKSNPESMGRFHTAWLNMMFPRLRLAANLLRDDGVIFISIDDNEVRNLRIICDEVFGEENFVAQMIW